MQGNYNGIKHSALPLNTLPYLLREQEESLRNKIAFNYINKHLNSELRITYTELFEKALNIAGTLSKFTETGDKVLLLLPEGPQFIFGIFGCWCAGIVPIPVAPSQGITTKRSTPRLINIMRDSNCNTILSSQKIKTSLNSFISQDVGIVKWILIDDQDGDSVFRPGYKNPEAPALIQYTSGTTGNPKGVVLSHKNLLSNTEAMKNALDLRPDSVGFSWLPPHHDMGLIGGILNPVYVGFCVTLMSPVHFLQRPLNWLKAISKFGVSVSGAPDFAYRLCVNKARCLQRENAFEDDLDLTSWDLAFCGSEKVRAATITDFCDTFSPYGFRLSSFRPCYGLAESTLMVTVCSSSADGPRILKCEPKAIQTGNYVSTRDRGANTITLVSSGVAVKDTKVLVVDPRTFQRLPDGNIGEILCSGSSVSRGYWQKDEVNDCVFSIKVEGEDSKFLKTGDLGFIQNGELFVTGRSKDIIVVNGKNHFPEDLEYTLESSLEIGATCVFASGTDDDIIVLCLELKTPKEDQIAFVQLAEFAKALLFNNHGLSLNRVIILRRGSLLKTTSGKVRRHATKSAVESGALNMLYNSTEEDASNEQPDKSIGLNKPSKNAPKTKEVVEGWLQNYLLSKLGSQIHLGGNFASMGLSSVDAVGLTADLGTFLQRDVSPTALWEYPTIEQLAKAISGIESGAAITVAVREEETRQDKAEIAIVGMACRTAGAKNLEAFWDLLISGRQSVGAAPISRPGANALNATGFSAGYLENVDAFDAAFFGISPDEAREMDPQQRLLMETVWHALESAGIPPSSLRNSPIGVFTGISNMDHSRGLANQSNNGPFAGTGSALSLAANRVSYFFDFTGPSIAIDTACSSSLVAVHLAGQALRTGEADLTIASGVNLILDETLTKIFDQAGMLSPDSKCHTFDNRANGYVRAEASAAIVLKPLSKALEDGNRVFATLCGSAVNQDGRSNGLTAPNVCAQRRCINKALEQSKISGDNVCYIEAHGTGTPLGDPIELEGISTEYVRADNKPCLVGSVKANVGHTEAAAGIIGLIKSALTLDRSMIPRQPDFQSLNSNITLPSWLSIAETNTLLTSDKNYAAVSSFGFGGTNSHIILSSAPANDRRNENQRQGRECFKAAVYPIRISAYDATAKEAMVQAFRLCLKAENTDLAALSNTSILHRERFKRADFVIGKSVEELIEGLDFLARKQPHPNLVVGNSPLNLVWYFTDVKEPERWLKAWTLKFPSIAARYNKILSLYGTKKPSLQASTIFLQVAVFELFEQQGLGKIPIVGANAGRIAAAALACRLEDSEIVSLVKEQTNSARKRPFKRDVASDRTLLSKYFEPLDTVTSEYLLAPRNESEFCHKAPSNTSFFMASDLNVESANTEKEVLFHNDDIYHVSIKILTTADSAGVAVNWESALKVLGYDTYTRPVQTLLYPFTETRYWIGHKEKEKDNEKFEISIAQLQWEEPKETSSTAHLRPLKWLILKDVGNTEQEMEIEFDVIDHKNALLSSDIQDVLDNQADIEGVVICPRMETGNFRQLASQLKLVADWGCELATTSKQLHGGIRVVTRGAFFSSQENACCYRSLWALVQTLQNEYSELSIQLIDLSPNKFITGVKNLYAQLEQPPGEHIALQGEKVLVPRLTDFNPLPSPVTPLRGLVVITGGMGKVGLALASSLVKSGYQNILLLGRLREINDQPLIQLREQGAQLRYRALDISDKKATIELFRDLIAAGERICGVIHAAGVLADGILARQQKANFSACLAPKAMGVANISAALEGQQLKFFAAISSLTGVLGSTGQGPYAAANAYLDGYMSRLRQKGITATSFALGMLSDGGMKVREGNDYTNALGLSSMTTSEAATIIVNSLYQNTPLMLISSRMKNHQPNVSLPLAIGTLVGSWLKLNLASPENVSELRTRLDSISPIKRTNVITERLVKMVAESLHVEDNKISIDIGLIELGLTSVSILQIRSRLQNELAFQIDAVVLFEKPTIRQLATHINTLIYSEGNDTQQNRSESSPRLMKQEQPSDAFKETMAFLDSINKTPNRSDREVPND